MADDILRALQASPEGLTKTEIHAALGRNRSGAEVGRALSALQEYGAAYPTDGDDSIGRHPERWNARI